MDRPEPIADPASAAGTRSGESGFLSETASYWRRRWSRPRRLLADGASFLLAVIGGTAVSLAVMLEVIVRMPLPARLYLAVGALGLALGAAAVVLDASRLRRLATAAGLVAVGLVLTVLYAVPWSPRKPFLRDLGRIEIGMTRTEVEEIMGAYIRGTGWPANPLGGASPGGLLRDASSGAAFATENSADGELAVRDSLVFRHSTDGDFDSDWGVVHFEADRVAAVDFLPD